MTFCTSCGKEVPPGKKFCEYCGAPVEQPAAAPPAPPVTSPLPTPVPSPVIPPAPSGKSGSGKIIAGVIILLIVIAVVYFVGLPLMNSSSGKDTTPRQGTVSLTPVPAATIPVTTVLPLITKTPGAIQTYEEKYTETYTQVYSTNHAFAGGQREVFTKNLVSPPLYIKFNITPTIDVGEKLDEYGNMVNTSYVSQTSWFKVSVYDAGTNALAEEQGFNKGFSIDTKQEFMVRAPGNYRVEMSGNNVVAEVRILTGKS